MKPLPLLFGLLILSSLSHSQVDQQKGIFKFGAEPLYVYSETNQALVRSGSDNPNLFLVDIEQDVILKTYDLYFSQFCRVSPYGDQIFYSNENENRIALLSTKDGKIIWEKEFKGRVEASAFDYQGKRLALFRNNQLGVYNLNDGSSAGFTAITQATSIGWLPLEEYVVFNQNTYYSDDKTPALIVYNVDRKKQVGRLVSADEVSFISTASNGLVAGYSFNGMVYIWQTLANGKLAVSKNTNPVKQIPCSQYCLSQSGKYLTVFEKNNFTIYETGSWKSITSGTLSSNAGKCFFFDNDSKVACRTSQRENLFIDVQSGKLNQKIYGETGSPPKSSQPATTEKSSQPVASTQAKKTEEPSSTQKPLPTASTGNPLDEVQLYFQQGNMPKAIEKLTEIINRGEGYVDEAYYYRGVAYVYCKDYAKSIADLEMALQLRPDQAHIYNDLAWVYMLERRFDMALRVLREGIKVDDELFPLTLNLANAYYLNGMQNEAKETYQKVFLLMESEEQFQNAVLADLDLFINENFRSDATAWKKWVTDYYNSGAKNYAIANRLYKDAKALKGGSKLAEAAQKFIQAAEVEEKASSPRQSKISLCYWGAGSCYFDLNQFVKVVPLYEKTLAIERKLAKGEALAYRLEFLYHTHTELKNIDIANAYKKEWDVEIARLKGIIAQNNDVRTACEDAYLAKDPVKGLKIANEWYEKIKNTAKDQMIASIISFRILFNDMQGNIGAVVQDFEMIKKTIKKETIKEDAVLMALPLVGNAYKKMGDKVNAMMAYIQTTEIAKEMESLEYEAMSYSLLGELFVQNYQFEKGLEQYNKVLGISEYNKIHMLTYKTYTLMGTLYSKWGKFDKALEYYNKSLDINRKIESGEYKYISESFKGQERALYDANLLATNKLDEIYTTMLVGSVYGEWGKSTEAKQSYQKALDMAKKVGHQRTIAFANNNLGSLALTEKNTEQAIQYFNLAKEYMEKANDQIGVVTVNNNLAMAYFNSNSKDQALIMLEKVIEISRRVNFMSDLAVALNNAGVVYSEKNDLVKALQYHSEALKIYRELKMRPDIAFTLTQFSILLLSQNKYDEAIKNLNEAISILEEVRLTATGSIKRDYVAKQIQAYGMLIDALMLKGNIEEALAAFENSKTRLLTEMLSERGIPAKKPTVKEIQASLQADQAVILFANVDYKMWKTLSAIVITKSTVTGKRIPLKDFVEKTYVDYKSDISQTMSNQRGFKAVKRDDDKSMTLNTEDQFADIINHYRSNLRNPNANSGEIAKRIYAQIVKPLETQFAGSKKLIIVPDGVLGFMPFETLIDGEGKYMIEKYSISYALSLTVQRMVSGRSYPDTRKPMLAFGGAIYDPGITSKKQVETTAQVENLQNDFYGRAGGKGPLRNEYSALGIGGWDEIPGSFEEVKRIEEVVKGAEVVVERAVSERYVKELSSEGKLKSYRVLHFATHGVVVPEIPELSALVLTQLRSEIFEDGYLRTEEIADLSIQADFVNLSACETGLGKIYGGEGVVGLTQSFLLAGANSLSVSLWQVNDISTQKFMVDVYREVATNQISYAQAIGKVKQKFIRGEFGNEYKLPYFWAPFVFYGN
jgi:CHAT domain-containing protein/Tfp pilus assembly protein PilF